MSPWTLGSDHVFRRMSRIVSGKHQPGKLKAAVLEASFGG